MFPMRGKKSIILPLNLPPFPSAVETVSFLALATANVFASGFSSLSL